MKVLVLLLSFVALTCAKSIKSDEEVGLLGYMQRYGVPLAEKIRKEEEAAAESRIVGGQLSQTRELPFQAGLLIIYPTGNGVCGGTLINNRRILTAAHCWFDGVLQGRSMTVVLGSTTLYTGGTRLITSVVVMHPQWNPSVAINDIAIVHLPLQLVFSDTILPISFPRDNEWDELFTGELALVSGFGRIADHFPIQPNQALSHTFVPIISNAECSAAFPTFTIHDSNICTSSQSGSTPCRGDSGGPLAVNRDRIVLVGITSYTSSEGCEAGFPAVYTRITSFMDFITANW